MLFKCCFSRRVFKRPSDMQWVIFRCPDLRQSVILFFQKKKQIIEIASKKSILKIWPVSTLHLTPTQMYFPRKWNWEFLFPSLGNKKGKYLLHLFLEENNLLEGTFHRGQNVEEKGQPFRLCQIRKMYVTSIF